MTGTASRVLWTGAIALVLVATGSLSAVGAAAASDRAAVEADFAIANEQLTAQSAEYSQAVDAAAEATTIAQHYVAATTKGLPGLTTGLDATLVTGISDALASLEDSVEAAPTAGSASGPILRSKQWATADYRAATEAAVTRLAEQRDETSALSMSTDAIVAQTAALDKAVAALVGSLPAASASLIAERAKADQPSKDTLTAAAKTAADATTIEDALAALAGYSNAAAAVVASHDAAVAAEAAAADAALSAEQAANLAASRERILAAIACFTDPACYLPKITG